MLAGKPLTTIAICLLCAASIQVRTQASQAPPARAEDGGHAEHSRFSAADEAEYLRRYELSRTRARGSDLYYPPPGLASARFPSRLWTLREPMRPPTIPLR